jgi:hypothetical protein
MCFTSGSQPGGSLPDYARQDSDATPFGKAVPTVGFANANDREVSSRLCASRQAGFWIEKTLLSIE